MPTSPSAGDECAPPDRLPQAQDRRVAPAGDEGIEEPPGGRTLLKPHAARAPKHACSTFGNRLSPVSLFLALDFSAAPERAPSAWLLA